MLLKKSALLFVMVILGFVPKVYGNEPETGYLFCYSTKKNFNHNGLHYAWSVDQEHWYSIGPEFTFIASDFGAWGSEKRMLNPFVFQDQNQIWHCIWSLNETVGQIAHASSEDLLHWGRQSYPTLMEDGNIIAPEVTYNSSLEAYEIVWLSVIGNEKKIYKTTTQDFKNYTPTQETTSDDLHYVRQELMVDGEKQLGVIREVNWELIQKLLLHEQWMKYHNQQREESMAEDLIRFKDLKDLEAQITVYPEKKKSISNHLIGVFFEDINYAADGGLYAELVQNRGFEYDMSDKKGRDSTWTHLKAWQVEGADATVKIDTVQPIHINNPHYAVFNVVSGGDALINNGFDGVLVKKDEKYNFSFFAKKTDGEKGSIIVSITDSDGKVVGQCVITNVGSKWKKYKGVINVEKSVDAGQLQLVPQQKGQYAFDMVSLFPQNTFMNRENGLRADLAQVIADIHPKFVRFPGGCVAHGDGIENIYRWKNTVGPLESRKPMRNIWNYHQSMGLGYFEYFQFCEDIGAAPIPVVAAGVPCQNSSCGGHGQQGGIPMTEMDAYVQEVLDLIEWANGDKSTKWGKVRAEAGHPKPFGLKYIGIGNEDLITDIFEERFTMIYKAVQEKYPDITVIGTVGPFYRGTDYEEGWALATKLKVPMVDEHYYQTPGWFIHNQDFYDKYDRNKSKVYLGEYAAHLPDRSMNIETALSEALYLTAVERNADVVEMTSFAPLLAKDKHTQWNPDLIYFNNKEVKPTVDYYVQQLYGQNSGGEYIPSLIQLSEKNQDVKKRVALSVVRDSKTDDLILKLVNLLPVVIDANINLSDLIESDKDAKLYVLSGEPESKEAIPHESEITISSETEYCIPAYSFSLIRIPVKN